MNHSSLASISMKIYSWTYDTWINTSLRPSTFNITFHGFVSTEKMCNPSCLTRNGCRNHKSLTFYSPGSSLSFAGRLVKALQSAFLAIKVGDIHGVQKYPTCLGFFSPWRPKLVSNSASRSAPTGIWHPFSGWLEKHQKVSKSDTTRALTITPHVWILVNHKKVENSIHPNYLFL